jgi:DNA-binding transcriptional MerR regulator
MKEATTEWLTAAECALRTGLTVRALRVYENHGLIAPGRSAAGWRRYGAAELVKLNEIGLLKVLGLTLTQIRDLTRRPTSPSLRQLLELQWATWKDRRAEADRGLAVVEAALQRLQTGRSLSVEELCSLIRSFEVNMTIEDVIIPAGAEQAALNAATLDRYVGYYSRSRSLGVSAITRKDTKLLLEPFGQAAVELEPTGEAEFAIRTYDRVLCFEEIENGAAKSMVIWQRGVRYQSARIDTETAGLIKQGLEERIKGRIALPGSEQAVRQMIERGREGGHPNYDQMSPEFAQVMRAQLPYWRIIGRYFGAIVSIEFLRVSNQGWDIYSVQHEHDVHRYRIALGDDGKVYGFGEASATADKEALA